MLLSYAYVAEYRYNSEVFENDNFLRLVPQLDDYQAPIRYEVLTRPSGGQVSYKDRFENLVHRVRVTTQHRELLVVSVGQAELRSRTLQAGDVRRLIPSNDPENLDFLGPSRFVEPRKLSTRGTESAGGGDHGG